MNCNELLWTNDPSCAPLAYEARIRKDNNNRNGMFKLMFCLYASGKDNMLPSGDEAKRLKNTLQNCIVRYFKDNGHTLLLVGYKHCNYVCVSYMLCCVSELRHHNFN